MSTDRSSLPPIILASGSPRRRELLGSLGLEFTVQPADIDEEAIEAERMSPSEIVCHLATEKARTVVLQMASGGSRSDALVIGSDTIVVLDGKVFGKPKDRADAHRMLKALQGVAHQVYSGIAVLYQGQTAVDYRVTDVTFRPMSDAQIEAYIATGEPIDKAGAYAIQGFGSLNVDRINGCYFNVVGMSLFLLNELFTRHGFHLLQPVGESTQSA